MLRRCSEFWYNKTILMKLLYLFPAFVFFTALLTAADPMNDIRHGSFAPKAPEPLELNILDWNIDRGTELDRIAKGIESQQPNIAILQEVDLDARRSGFKDIARELAERLHLNYAFATEFQELGQSASERPAYHGQATLSSLPIRESRMLRFKAQSTFWKPRAYLPKWALFQRRLGGRIALVSDLDYKGQTLVVYNLHLESRSAGEIQYQQLQEVLKDTERYPKDTPIVIAGDLNTKYAHSTKEVMKLMRDSGYESAFGDRQERTHWLVGDLDWIFTRGPIRISDGIVHRDLHGSDHFAVSARITPAHQVARQ